MKISIAQYRTILATYLKSQWRQSALLLLLLLGGTGLKLLNPVILASFIDRAMAGGALPSLIQLALLFLGIALVTQLIVVGENYLATNIGLIATNQLRADLALHCLQLDMGFHNNRTPGELIERIDGDVGHLSNFFARFIVDLVGNGILLIGVLFALARIDWRVGAALTIFALLTLLVTYGMRNIAVGHFEQTRQAHAELFGFLEERLSGTEDVRSSGATGYVMHRFYERGRALFRKDLKAHVVGTAAYGTMLVLFALGTILALGIGIYLFQAGAITIGIVYLIFRYTELLTQPIEQFGRQLQDLQQAGASLIRIQQLLATQSQLPESGEATLPATALPVTFEHVGFRYAAVEHGAAKTMNGAAISGETPTNNELVLSDISFALPAGAILGLLGRTGSGKTTLTRLLLRLYDPTQGNIYLGDTLTPAISMALLRQRIGVVSQEIQLFHASVRNNLTLFEPTIPDARILAVLKELGLWDWYSALPAGLESKLTPGGSGLSAGEAQLLAFVRVFLKDPGLVILDEASSRLDPATEQLLEKAVDRLLTGRTAIIIAHRLATVQRADNIMILEQGRCIEYGPRAQLVDNPESRFAHLLRTGLEEALA
ncbi:MAG: ABC transporter ATP-binding protein [Chloroflexi bacterium]|nr:ABC transporter ATP-binding protein [Chloroflexota bacterium]